MQESPDQSEVLRRYAVALERLCAASYPLSITITVDAEDASRLETQDGKPLRQCGLIVSDNDKWEGDLIAALSLRDLQMDNDYYWSLSPLLHEWGPHLVDLWGEAVLKSHLGDFEMFSTHVAPAAWERACTKSIHRHYGLTFVSEEDDKPSSLRFVLHASAIAAAVNKRLQRAAEEGNVE
jgi:hypothetical protein